MTATTTNQLDNLIEQERKRSAEKIAKLKRAAAVEQKRIDARVIVLLSERHPGLHEQLAADARAALDVERLKRSTRAKGGALATQPEPASHEPFASEHASEEAPWNG